MPKLFECLARPATGQAPPAGMSEHTFHVRERRQQVIDVRRSRSGAWPPSAQSSELTTPRSRARVASLAHSGFAKQRVASVHGTDHPSPTPIQDVGVDHGRADVGMAKQFLNCPYVVAGFEQVGGKTVAQGMWAHRFDDVGPLSGATHRALHTLFADRVAAHRARPWIAGKSAGREYVLPPPRPWGALGYFMASASGNHTSARPGLGQHRAAPSRPADVLLTARSDRLATRLTGPFRLCPPARRFPADRSPHS